MSRNQVPAKPDADFAGTDVLKFSKNEKQLLQILDMPPEMACEIAVPKEIRQGIYSIPGISNLVHPPAEWDLFTVCRALLAGLMYRYLQDTDDIRLRGLLLVFLQMICLRCWRSMDSSARVNLQNFQKVHWLRCWKG